MKKIIAILGLLVLCGTAGCTKQTMVMKFGGTMTLDLQPNQRLEMITWKEGNQLWYLTRDRQPNEPPVNHTFKEKTTLGVLSGTINIVEH